MFQNSIYQIIGLAISSGVVGALITGLFSFFSKQKSDSLQYVTSERKQWREELRKLSLELLECDYDDCKIILTKIKVRINAFGNNREASYFEDKHIWDEMREMTRAASDENGERFNECKENLIYYLSLLLKYDWERSKKEVRGRTGEKVAGMALILGFIYCIVLNHILNGDILSLLFLILGAIMFPFSLPIVYEEKKKILKGNSRIKKILVHIFELLLLAEVIGVYGFLLNVFTSANVVVSYWIILLVFALFLLFGSVLFFTNTYYDTYNERVKGYVEEVKKSREDHE